MQVTTNEYVLPHERNGFQGLPVLEVISNDQLLALRTQACIEHLHTLRKLLEMDYSAGDVIAEDVTEYATKEYPPVLKSLTELYSSPDWRSVEDALAESGFPLVLVESIPRIYITRQHYLNSGVGND